MRILFLALLLFLNCGVFAQKNISKKEKQEIIALLEKQEAAWNDGNLKQFMDTYWKSDSLIFIGSRGPSYGWQKALDNYKRGYPTKNAMGKLKFNILNIRKIDSKTVFVVGQYHVMREIGDLTGNFSLVVQSKKQGWVIVSDHSSAGNLKKK